MPYWPHMLTQTVNPEKIGKYRWLTFLLSAFRPGTCDFSSLTVAQLCRLMVTTLHGAMLWPVCPSSRLPHWLERGLPMASYYESKTGKRKVTGHCGSVLACLVHVLRGAGIFSAPVPEKLLLMGGSDDCYISARGCTATWDNFAKAIFDAISRPIYLTPDPWKDIVFRIHTRVSIQKTQAPAVDTT
ncbi:hypothetical protein NN561_010063 [Cricetulus griseus]